MELITAIPQNDANNQPICDYAATKILNQNPKTVHYDGGTHHKSVIHLFATTPKINSMIPR